METRLLEALYDRIDDYFDRNREWFNEYFFLLEKYVEFEYPVRLCFEFFNNSFN